jgi:hypothetical protein
MSYNKENLLKRIEEVQNIVSEYQKKGISRKQIFMDFIEEKYHISYSCFNRYLGVGTKQKSVKN